ncbi:MAG: helix-turn-helix domain-containing protein [Patescibacteria group bacterium]|nr:helix-turn-helix domain-containing protein [Patescibacteria group bacterium]
MNRTEWIRSKNREFGWTADRIAEVLGCSTEEVAAELKENWHDLKMKALAGEEISFEKKETKKERVLFDAEGIAKRIYEDGEAISEVAETIGMTPEALNKLIMNGEIVKPGTRPTKIDTQESKNDLVGGQQAKRDENDAYQIPVEEQKQWNPYIQTEEHAEIVRLYKEEHLGGTAIAKKLGISKSSVYNHLAYEKISKNERKPVAVCANCERIFVTRPSVLKKAQARGINVFCTTECSKKWRKKTKKEKYGSSSPTSSENMEKLGPEID